MDESHLNLGPLGVQPSGAAEVLGQIDAYDLSRAANQLEVGYWIRPAPMSTTRIPGSPDTVRSTTRLRDASE